MPDPRFADPITATIAAFLESIGLTVQAGPVPEHTFLPGIWIERGGLVIDEPSLQFPGDLLHEAGHLAVADPARRMTIVGDAGPDPAEEMMAIAWSYAAVVHLKLDPAVVFHPAGYRGQAASIVENFGEGRYFGVPMLQWLGMTYDATQAPAHAVAPFPHMVRWLRAST